MWVHALGESKERGRKSFKYGGGGYDGEDEYSAVKTTIAGASTIVLDGGGSVVSLGQDHTFLDSKRDDSSSI